MAATLLLVDDESKLLDFLRLYLERAGFSVLTTRTGAGAITLARSARPDLVVLDLGLPDIRGDHVARTLLAESGPPILVLSGRTSEEDRVGGLELGAEDYVTKPFSPRELVLRIGTVLRRHGAAPCESWPPSFGGGALMIDEQRRTVLVSGRAVELTASEWRILTALATVPGRVYSRAELVGRVHRYEFDAGERSIDSHVKNLRHKIEQDPRRPRIVVTMVGAGYRLGMTRDDRPG
jgi:DNA-binding response OmpR family regulator